MLEIVFKTSYNQKIDKKEEYYMKGKSLWLKVALAVSLMATNPVITMAQEVQPKVLTIKQAIDKAKEESVTLAQNKRAQDLNEEKEEMAESTSDIQGMRTNNLNKVYTQKQESIIEEQIERSIKQAFDDIIYTKATISTLEKQLSVQQRQIEKYEKMQALGQIDKLSVDQVKLAYEQTNTNKVIAEKSLEAKYASLCILVGDNKTTLYTLEKEENIYSPYTLDGTIDAYAAKKASENLALWKAKEEAKIAEDPNITYDFMTRLSNNEAKHATLETVKTTNENLQESIKQNYAALKKLESQYLLKVEDLKVKEKELQVSQIKFAQGMISELEKDSDIVEYEAAKEELTDLINQHTYLKELLEKPYLS